MCVGCPTWSQVWVVTTLALLAGVEHHDISNVAFMWDSRGVLTLVVLSDKLLLALFDVLPVGFK